MKVVSQKVFASPEIVNPITGRYCMHAASFDYFKGKRISAWFQGYQEGSPDCHIKIVIGDQADYQHDSSFTIGKYMNVPFWNPIVFTVNEQVFLFYKAGIFCDRWQTFLLDITSLADGTYSGDSDLSESMASTSLPAGVNGSVKTKPLIINDGYDTTVLCGSSVETFFSWASYFEVFRMHHPGSLQFFGRSDPLNKSSKFIIQPSLCSYKQYVLAFARSKNSKVFAGVYVRGDFIYSEKSPFFYPHFDELSEFDCDNPNSSVDSVVSGDSLYLIVNNDAKYRSELSVLKYNLGEWADRPHGQQALDFILEDKIVIDDGTTIDEETAFTNENSYPFARLNSEGHIDILYTSGRSQIKNVIIGV